MSCYGRIFSLGPTSSYCFIGGLGMVDRTETLFSIKFSVVV